MDFPSNGLATVLNGLTLNGTAVIMDTGGVGSGLFFSGSQELAGTGTIHFASNVNNQVRALSDTLTIGPGITIRGQRGTVGHQQHALVNKGVILSDETGTIVVTGSWGVKAAKQAGPYANVNVAADAAADHYRSIPSRADWHTTRGAAYLHYTPNETIGGVEFHEIPDTGDVPLVADMSSTILSRPIDVSRFGVLYAGAQKNIGPA